MDLDTIAQTISRAWHDEVLPHISVFIDWVQDGTNAFYMLGAFAVGVILGRFRTSGGVGVLRRFGFQNRGEALLSKTVQARFGAPDYHLMNHVTLRLSDGTTQVDHILVSRFGVFVIESKDHTGWIFADAHQAKWTQVLFSFRSRFQNPIFQNSRHVRAVRDLLEFLPPDAIKSVVVFTGTAEFKTQIPDGVFDIPGFIDHVRGHTVEVMSLNRMQFCVGRIETARLAISGMTDVEHVQSLARRHSGRSW